MLIKRGGPGGFGMYSRPNFAKLFSLYRPTLYM